MQLDQVKLEDFDGVMIPGGALNGGFMRVVPKAQALVQKMNQDCTPMAIICHGPWLWVSSGLVKGRTLTSYPTIQDDIRNAGGN